MNIWQKALEGSNRGTFEKNAGDTINSWCRCVFCASNDTSFKARLDAVSAGWRTLKGKWICPKCMDIIRRSVNQGVS